MKPAVVVAVLTPLLAALAGYIADQATRLPGAPQLDRTGMTAVFVAGVTAAAGAGLTFLHHLLTMRRVNQARADAAVERQHELAVASVSAPPEVPVEEISKLAAAVGAVSSRLDALESARGPSRRRRVTRP